MTGFVRLDVPLQAADLLRLHQRHPFRYPCLLESAAQGGKARYDLLLGFPQSGLRLDADGVTRDLAGQVQSGRFLNVLDRQWQMARLPMVSELPYLGGWALYLGYELLTQTEPCVATRPAPANLPVALALRCPVALIHDRANGLTCAVLEANDAQGDWQQQLCEDIAALADSRVAECADALPDLRIDEDDPESFLDGVRRIHEYLRAGDVFQVNLSRGWQARASETLSHDVVYSALRRANPAPFAGLLSWDDWAILSSSPERLLSVRDGLAETRPIAGTRARRPNDSADDVSRLAELIGHPKERAEHVMLIDLERNDLGRVCVPGSVRVDELMALESYAHVHHIVSNVRGQLRPEVTPGQAIAATFPGGTITGCPKVRCMQIIHELEAVGRGPYTGALGYLDRRGDLDLNILIRTLWMRDNALHFRAGAGIVVDSVPESELAETRAKARGLLRALGMA